MPDLLRVARAVATNQVARLSPRAYLSLTGQTGRGDALGESPEYIASYFKRCVDDYLAFAGVPAEQAESWLAGKTIVEYGPGDFPGVALLLLALGARKVYCVDRFPMVRLSQKNAEVWSALIASLTPIQLERARALLRNPQAPSEGFHTESVQYVVRAHGFSGLQEVCDLALSRAVLEHVDDLPGTFGDMRAALKPGGVAIHLVDLKSHGLHQENPLDFLAWPNWLWSLMYSHKGVPNRWRLDRYREIVDALGVESVRLEPTQCASASDVLAVRPLLSPPFRDLDDEDLACLGLWIGFRKPAA
ncbi:MAG: methyltransferase type 12 [Burkholderiales bacterium PBB1]|nr:MAG: methyltransferase type 12 [Burkholderiales bacterium PBB1]